jgi:hypothetical protein
MARSACFFFYRIRAMGAVNPITCGMAGKLPCLVSVQRAASGQGLTRVSLDLGRFSPETGLAAQRPSGATAAPANIRNWHDPAHVLVRRCFCRPAPEAVWGISDP